MKTKVIWHGTGDITHTWWQDTGTKGGIFWSPSIFPNITGTTPPKVVGFKVNCRLCSENNTYQGYYVDQVVYSCRSGDCKTPCTSANSCRICKQDFDCFKWDDVSTPPTNGRYYVALTVLGASRKTNGSWEELIYDTDGSLPDITGTLTVGSLPPLNLERIQNVPSGYRYTFDKKEMTYAASINVQVVLKDWKENDPAATNDVQIFDSGVQSKTLKSGAYHSFNFTQDLASPPSGRTAKMRVLVELYPVGNPVP